MLRKFAVALITTAALSACAGTATERDLAFQDHYWGANCDNHGVTNVRYGFDRDWSSYFVRFKPLPVSRNNPVCKVTFSCADASEPNVTQSATVLSSTEAGTTFPRCQPGTFAISTSPL
ncbi:MAG: hypothetical protein H7Y60_12460 [Rhodospirillaceae bacterium]|nr:hypothetical protein [Rhodospirillales bacterium]